jgi:hypothetical protein
MVLFNNFSKRTTARIIATHCKIITYILSQQAVMNITNNSQTKPYRYLMYAICLYSRIASEEQMEFANRHRDDGYLAIITIEGHAKSSWAFNISLATEKTLRAPGCSQFSLSNHLGRLSII